MIFERSEEKKQKLQTIKDEFQTNVEVLKSIRDNPNTDPSDRLKAVTELNHLLSKIESSIESEPLF